MNNINNKLFDLYLVLDSKFIVEYAEFNDKNPFKHSQHLLCGKNIFNLIDKELDASIKNHLLENNEWKGAVKIYYPWNADESFYGSFLMVESGKIMVGLIHSTIDTSNKKELDKKTILETIFNTSHCLFSINSLIDNADSISYYGDVLGFTGYTKDELLSLDGKTNAIIYPDDIQYVLKSKNNIFQNKSNKTNIVYRIAKKDTSIIWVNEMISVKRDRKNNPLKIISIYSDITDQKSSEERLKLAIEELTALEASRIRFINILAHDLRAPFTSILGFAEILLNEQALPEKDKKEYLTYIYDASQNQLNFTNYLLDWSRLKSGSINIEPKRLKIADIVYNEVSNLTGNAVRKNIEIKTDISENIYVLADERLIGQVFLNLINNAIKYSNENSIIEVNANIYNEKYAEFVVKDFGIGLTAEDKKKIFNLEESFTKEGTKGEKGTGLGLALVQEIVMKHNGDIWFFSEENVGTEFHFIIPVASKMVLLVESDEQHKETITSLIKKNYDDVDLIYADNGFEALNLLGEYFPVLVIINDHLPMMNAKQFLESARSIFSGFSLPIIVLSEKNKEEIGSKETAKLLYSDKDFNEIDLLNLLKPIL